MSFDILPQLAIIVSLMGILLIISRNLSKVKELEGQEEIFLRDVEIQEEREKFNQLTRRAASRVMDKETYERALSGFWFWLEKFLRRTRITFLKLDTKIAALLKNLREKNADIAEKAEEEAEVDQSEPDLNSKEEEAQGFAAKRRDIRDKAESFFRRRKKTEETMHKVETVQSNDREEFISSDVNVSTQRESDQVRTQKEQEYIEALIKNPRDINAYWKLGILYYRRRNFNDSLACFRQIVKIDPDHDRAKEKALELIEKMRAQHGESYKNEE